MLYFNFNNEFLKDLVVCKVIVLGVDREFYVNMLLKGIVVLVIGFFLGLLFFGDKNFIGYKYN